MFLWLPLCGAVFVAAMRYVLHYGFGVESGIIIPTGLYSVLALLVVLVVLCFAVRLPVWLLAARKLRRLEAQGQG